MYENNSKIVHIVLKHLNKKIQGKLNSVHANYSLMPRAIRLSKRDGEFGTPLLDKWIPRVGDLKLMIVGAKQQEDRYPKVVPTYRFVKEVKEQ